MNKCFSVLLPSLVFMWSLSAFSSPEIYRLGNASENNVLITYYLESKSKYDGSTEIINKSGTTILFSGENNCKIELKPDSIMTWDWITKPCRRNNTWRIELKEIDSRNNKIKCTKNKHPLKLKFGFERDAKYLIITNEREKL